jgi:hypothetical protein
MSLGLPNEDMEMLDAAQGIIEKVLESFSSENPRGPVMFCSGDCSGTCLGACAGGCWGCNEAWRQ